METMTFAMREVYRGIRRDRPDGRRGIRSTNLTNGAISRRSGRRLAHCERPAGAGGGVVVALPDIGVSVGALVERLGRLSDDRMHEVCAALAVAVDCSAEDRGRPQPMMQLAAL